MTLTVERLRHLFNYDPETGLFTVRAARRGGRSKVGDLMRVSISNQCGHLRTFIDYKNHLVHRLAWLHFYGTAPVGIVDHINGNPADNRIANLRVGTHRQNQQNRTSAQTNNSTGRLGVSYQSARNKYIAMIRVAGKHVFLGRFDSADEASDAYIKAKRKHHEFNTL